MSRLAKRVRGIGESVTLQISAKAKSMKKDGVDVVGLAAGEPDFDTPDHIKAEAVKAIKEGFTKYTPASGMPELKEAICRKFKSDSGLDYASPQVVVSNGAKHSLYNIFEAICDEGDEILIPSPYWLSYPAMVKLCLAKPIFIETGSNNNYKITRKDLERMITPKTKAIVLNSPSNPTGCVYDKSELEFIAEAAVKNKIYVVSDEIYDKLIYDGKKHVSIASLGKDIYDLTFTVNGVSKSYSMTGWRIGYTAGPQDAMKVIANLQSHGASNPSSISQRAAIAALTQDQSCLEKMRQEFANRRDLMMSLVADIKNMKAVRPEGAFYVFCDISEAGMDSLKFATRLLDEAKVAVIPGGPFGANGCIRLSFATSRENIEKGLGRIKEWMKTNG